MKIIFIKPRSIKLYRPILFFCCILMSTLVSYGSNASLGMSKIDVPNNWYCDDCPSALDSDMDGLTDCEETTGEDDPSTSAVPDPIIFTNPLDACDPFFFNCDEDDADPANIDVFDVALDIVLTSSGPYEQGMVVSFDITIYNQGNIHLYDIDVAQYFNDEELIFLSLNPSSTSENENAVSIIDNSNGAFQLEEISVGDEVEITVDFQINNGCTLVNNAEIITASNIDGASSTLVDADFDLAIINDGSSTEIDIDIEDDYDSVLISIEDNQPPTPDEDNLSIGNSAALSFDGENDLIRIYDYSPVAPELTASCWFKADDVPAASTYEERFFTFGYNHRVEVGVNSGKLWMFDSNGQGPITLNYPLRDGEWHHVAIVFEDNSRKLYLDGTEVHSYTGAGSQTYGPYFTISGWHGSQAHFHGLIDEFQFWTEAKSEEDINEQMNCQLIGDEENLGLYFNFNEGVPDEDNTSITTIDNGVINSSLIGTIQNMSLNGTESNYADGYIDFDEDCPGLNTYISECSATPPTPTATDNCGEVIDGVSDKDFPITELGTTPIMWTYTDAEGNMSTQFQNVIVINSLDYYSTDVTLDSDILLAGGEVNVSVEQSVTGLVNDPIEVMSGYYFSTDELLDDTDILLDEDLSTFSDGVNLEAETATLVLPEDVELGDYFILFVSDNNDAQLECTEDNNVQAEPFSIVDPDYFGAEGSLSLSSVAPGGSTLASSRQSVDQLASSSILQVKYYLSDDDLFEASDIELASDYATLSTTDLYDVESASLTIPADTEEDDYYILIVSDPDDLLAESNEDNNTIALPLLVTSETVTYDDFYIQGEELDSEVVGPGESLKATCYQWYDGTTSVNQSVYLGYYFSTDAEFDADEDILMGTDYSTISTMDLSDKESITFNIPNDAEAGTAYIIFVTDYESEFEESDEANNIEVVAFTVGASIPSEDDFSISSPSVNNLFPVAGNSITMSFDSDYTGNSSSILTVGSKYYLSEDEAYDASDILLGSEFSTLSVSDTSDPESKTAYIPGDVAVGTYYILFITDFTDSFVETDESNNLEAIAITIEGEDVYVAPDNPLVMIEQIQATEPSIDIETDNLMKRSEMSEDLIVYPNPASSLINLNYSEEFDAYQIIIVNATGKMIFSRQQENDNSKTSIDVSSFTNGIYYVFLTNENSSKRLASKFLKI